MLSEENTLPKHRDYKEKLNATKSSDMPNSIFRGSGADWVIDVPGYSWVMGEEPEGIK